MNICLLGATGRTGQHIMKFVLQDMHHLTVLVREREKLQQEHEKLRVLEGNVLHAEDIIAAAAGADVVISTLGTDGEKVLSESMPHIIQAMNQHHISRIVTVGTAGILQARSAPAVYRFQSSESRRKSTVAAEDHLKAYEQLRDSGLNWTVVCPTHLIDGEATYEYRTEKDMLPDRGTKINVGDTAHFTYNQLFTEEFEQHRVGIAY
ncbi:NAD(P)H-binding protein [Bacillus sp. 165]|uniref:NAD(P)-dependent oxidoreductase n=1 Tax=Bacillus sp. 165 TaxID=1529117 RepID=UPI001ADB31DD|nr:NAD(P)H-binding protein [Bacillus sp. 165]MBO9128118.1 NAD(P)H-binding protein [Bacillus sp. 165]